MYRITQCLSLGSFVHPERAARLLGVGITHVLNVSEGPSAIAAGKGSFQEVVWVPIADGPRLLPATAIATLDALHRLVSVPGSHVYTHCVMGQMRAPTVLWLYLIACGFEPDDARELIELRSPDAVAGHPRLVSEEHVVLAQMHGLAHYFPHPRGEALVPFPVGERGELP